MLLVLLVTCYSMPQKKVKDLDLPKDLFLNIEYAIAYVLYSPTKEITKQNLIRSTPFLHLTPFGGY